MYGKLRTERMCRIVNDSLHAVLLDVRLHVFCALACKTDHAVRCTHSIILQLVHSIAEQANPGCSSSGWLLEADPFSVLVVSAQHVRMALNVDFRAIRAMDAQVAGHVARHA